MFCIYCFKIQKQKRLYYLNKMRERNIKIKEFEAKCTFSRFIELFIGFVQDSKEKRR